MIYDTLELAKALQLNFPPEQAEALVTAFSESTLDTVATKADLVELKAELIEWGVGAIAFNLLGTVGIMIAVAELVLKTR